MILQSVVVLKVLDKVAENYDFPIKNEQGVETGRNTGVNYWVTVKADGKPENIKLPKDRKDIFDALTIGKEAQIIFKFETEPKAYIKDGKALVNFMHVPTIVDLVPVK